MSFGGFRRFIKRRVLLPSLIMVASTVSFAQQSNQQATMQVKDYLKERQVLSQKFNKGTAINIGMFGINFEGVREGVEKFIPISNYLTNSMQELVVLSVDRDSAVILDDAAMGVYDFAYLASIEAYALYKKGWIPILQRKENVVPMIAVHHDSNINFKDPASVKGLKIVAPSNTAVTDFGLYFGDKDGLWDKNEVVVKPLNPREMASLVLTKQVDAVLARSTLIGQWTKQQGLKIKEGMTLPYGPGSMLLAKPGTPPNKITTIQKALLDLNYKNKETKLISEGFEGLNARSDSVFKEVNLKEFESVAGMKEVLVNINKKVKSSFTVK